MNDEARAELDRILALEPAALTESDRAVLQARRDYLTEEQQNVYGVSDESSSETVSGESEQPRARRGRKASDSEQPEA
jgi:hypothetical protein